mmetsp:Transcript_21904/g.74440  ORF Transcript_21904/g.74440 Transcript_21904/m.74440 type:complete len:208 (-) Transcript_21904:473-1096(-)
MPMRASKSTSLLVMGDAAGLALESASLALPAAGFGGGMGPRPETRRGGLLIPFWSARLLPSLPSWPQGVESNLLSAVAKLATKDGMKGSALSTNSTRIQLLKPTKRLRPIWMRSTGRMRQLRKPPHVRFSSAKNVSKNRLVPSMSSCISVSMPKHMKVRILRSSPGHTSFHTSSLTFSISAWGPPLRSPRSRLSTSVSADLSVLATM